MEKKNRHDHTYIPLLQKSTNRPHPSSLLQQSDTSPHQPQPSHTPLPNHPLNDNSAPHNQQYIPQQPSHTPRSSNYTESIHRATHTPPSPHTEPNCSHPQQPYTDQLPPLRSTPHTPTHYNRRFLPLQHCILFHQWGMTLVMGGYRNDRKQSRIGFVCISAEKC
jgi:hypothetical protein